MRYPGSKRRFRHEIVALVCAHRGEREAYLEPFIGGGESFEAVAPLFPVAFGGDAREDIALLWAAVAEGWLPPTSLTQQDYAALRHGEPSPLRGFAGAGCSFGGKWFGGYASGGLNADGTPRDHTAESSRAVARAAPAFKGRWVRHAHYTDWAVSADMVVYCDPPYAGTLGYGIDYDVAEFWRTVTGWAQLGACVLVSEQQAPAHWTPVATFGRLSSTDLARRRTRTLEHVFMSSPIQNPMPGDAS